MKFVSAIFSVVALLVGNQLGFAQGFVNLDFESANISGNVTGNEITAANAFPGWTVTADFIYYDDFSLSGGSISVFDSNPPFSFPPIQGTYFAYLVGPGAAPYTVSIGQTGQIPDSAQSITFWGTDPGLEATFNGQPLNFQVIGSTANYNIYSADISSFAGQTGPLLFTQTLYGNSKLDNIQFSSSSVPEPSELALTALGALLLGLSRLKEFLQFTRLKK